jgi:hypothetical protein
MKKEVEAIWKKVIGKKKFTYMSYPQLIFNNT